MTSHLHCLGVRLLPVLRLLLQLLSLLIPLLLLLLQSGGLLPLLFGGPLLLLLTQSPLRLQRLLDTAQLRLGPGQLLTCLL